MYKVINGERPGRPPSGFSDVLWELLMESWLVEHARKPQERPPASTVLDRLKRDVDHWEKTIIPLVPKEWRGSGGCPSYSIKCRSLLMTPLQ